MGKQPERTTYGGMTLDGVVWMVEGQRGQWTLSCGWAVSMVDGSVLRTSRILVASLMHKEGDILRGDGGRASKAKGKMRHMKRGDQAGPFGVGYFVVHQHGHGHGHTRNGPLEMPRLSKPQRARRRRPAYFTIFFLFVFPLLCIFCTFFPFSTSSVPSVLGVRIPDPWPADRFCTYAMQAWCICWRRNRKRKK